MALIRLMTGGQILGHIYFSSEEVGVYGRVGGIKNRRGWGRHCIKIYSPGELHHVVFQSDLFFCYFKLWIKILKPSACSK